MSGSLSIQRHQIISPIYENIHHRWIKIQSQTTKRTMRLVWH